MWSIDAAIRLKLGFFCSGLYLSRWIFPSIRGELPGRAFSRSSSLVFTNAA